MTPGRRLNLRQACSQRLGERAPEPVSDRIVLLEERPDVGRFAANEIEFRFRRVAVLPIFAALQNAERDKRIEEIPGAALVKPQPPHQCARVRGRSDKAVKVKLDGAEQDLAGAVAEADFEDAAGGGRSAAMVSIGSASRQDLLATVLLSDAGNDEFSPHSASAVRRITRATGIPRSAHQSMIACSLTGRRDHYGPTISSIPSRAAPSDRHHPQHGRTLPSVSSITAARVSSRPH